MRILTAFLATTALLGSANETRATKPCPPSPCLDSSGKLDRAKCEDSAAWVAVGTISNVVHHPAGPPLLKDFAELTFKVQRWEKGAGKVGQELRFKVGWCENREEPPADASALVRVFGALPAFGNEQRYIFLESLKSRESP
jgi:hypothetical protein